MGSLSIQHTRVASLRPWRDRELQELFATLAPAPDISGVWSGRLFAVRGLGWLPRPLTRGIYALLATPLNPWRGKSFANGTGSNQWFRLNGPAFGHYLIERQTGPDGNPSLWLNYDVANNPGLLRSVRGEARLLQENVLLCRMLWQSKQGLTTLLWFSLHPGTQDDH